MEAEINGKKAQINVSKKKISFFVMLIIVLTLLATGLYKINPEEVGVIQRFGKYIKTTQPGLHIKIPFGVDKLTKVKVKVVYKEEFGFRTLQPGVKTRYSARDYSSESLMLTGDLNIAEVEWIVQYKIKDPVAFLFNVRNLQETLRDISEAVTRKIIGDRSVDEVIVLSRRDIANEIEIKLQKTLDRYKSGIKVVTVNLQNVNPPKPVQPAFNDVNSAKQEEERIVNDAWQEYNKIIPEARGKAKRTIEEAQGYGINRVNRAKGDADRFNQVLKEYKKAKTVTQKRLYIETMQEILNSVNEIYIVDKELKNVLPLLNLNKGGK